MNVIRNESCLVTMAALDAGSIDLVVTSPPYDDLREYNGYSFDFNAVVAGLYRVIKDGGVIVWIVGDATVKGSETGTSFRQAIGFQDAGFLIHDTMIWRKTNPLPKLKTRRYFDVFEYMFVFSKGKPETFNPIMQPTKLGGKTYDSTAKKITPGKERTRKTFVLNKERYRDNIWDCAVARNQTDHPAVFPEALVADHIWSWSNAGDLVYDPFMGSGTTALAAITSGRNYLGSEISLEYCTIARDQIERRKRDLVSQTPLI